MTAYTYLPGPVRLTRDEEALEDAADRGPLAVAASQAFRVAMPITEREALADECPDTLPGGEVQR